MENIPESAKHIACDFFLDVELLCVVRDEAVFDFGDEVHVIKLGNGQAQVGEFGRLALFHTAHSEQWQFRPYQSVSWRRAPELDSPSNWVWRCIRTGEFAITAIGTLPTHQPTAHLPVEDVRNEFPF